MHPTKCPFLPNWSTRKDGTCKRFDFCPDSRKARCPAIGPPGVQRLTFRPVATNCPSCGARIVYSSTGVFYCWKCKRTFRVLGPEEVKWT